jgi:beta-glucosidase
MMAGTISEEGADRATFTDKTGKERVEIGNNLDWYVDKPNTIATLDGENKAKNSNTVAMIKAVMDAAPAMEEKTSLVLKDNAGVAMDPELVGESGPAILEAWFPGQEDGNIVADLLFGVENPSGKSPVTYPYVGKGFMDSASTLQFPGDIINGKQTVEYTEKLNIGYRWYDSNVSGNCDIAEDGSNSCVAFPFGHGLSYSDFETSKLTVTPKVNDGTRPIKVQFFVENTGDVAGSEVPQVYLSLPESANEPPKRLVGFEKVELEPGEKKRVEITIDPDASNHPLSTWDAEADEWTTPTGEFDVLVGNSSGDLTLSDTIKVRTPATKK